MLVFAEAAAVQMLKVLKVMMFIAAVALLVMLATEALKVRRGEGGCVERPIFSRVRKIIS